MAFSDDAPSTHITGYVQFTSAGDGSAAAATFANSTEYMAIPVAQAPLANLTAAEANATTGSWRKVVYELMNLFWTGYNNITSADRPTKVVMSRSGLSAVSGSATEVERTISGKIRLDASSLDVIAE